LGWQPARGVSLSDMPRKTTMTFMRELGDRRRKAIVCPTSDL